MTNFLLYIAKTGIKEIKVAISPIIDIRAKIAKIKIFIPIITKKLVRFLDFLSLVELCIKYFW